MAELYSLKPWSDEETLKYAYGRNEYSARQTANYLGCSVSTIIRWLEEFGLKDLKSEWKREGVLRELYLEKGLSQIEIADKFGLTQDTIAYWLEKNGITPHECPTCDKQFSSYSGVKIHHKNVHGDSIAGEAVTCDNCGKEFRRSRSQILEYNFCSYDCKHEWFSDWFAGENHFAWKGGVRPDYGKGWDDEKRAEVREQYGYECYNCGMAQEEHIDRYGAKLHVHHVKPALEFDDAEERNSLSNLIPLCAGCHAKWESAT